MMRIEDRIKEYVCSRGADIVGVAPVDRFQDAPKGFHPTDILADAQAVIVLGKNFPKGLLVGTSRAAMTKAMNISFDILDVCAFDLSCFLEGSGAATVPVPSDSPYFWFDKGKQEGRGDLSHKHAAVLAGLGSLGKNSLLLTPQYGNRVNLVSVVTGMSLKGDPFFEGNLCLKQCDICIQSCPGGAIKENGLVSQKECRKHHSTKTDRGFSLFSCWACRDVCPVKGILASG